MQADGRTERESLVDRAPGVGGAPADVPPAPVVAPTAQSVRGWRALAAALALLLCGGGVLFFTSRDRQEQKVMNLMATLTNRDTRIEQLERMLGATRLELVHLSGAPPQPRARGRVFRDLTRNEWHFFAFDLAPLPQGRRYALWFITADQGPVPAGTFDADDNGRGYLLAPVPADIGDVAATTVTDEPEGGSPARTPTGAVQLTGEVR